MRKVIAVVLAVLFLVTLASTTVSAVGTKVPTGPTTQGPPLAGHLIQASSMEYLDDGSPNVFPTDYSDTQLFLR